MITLGVDEVGGAVQHIRWKDGHDSLYTGYALRLGCGCAQCVDELSGQKRLREESISRDVRPLAIEARGPVRGPLPVERRPLDGHLPL